jgi:hypothetical protein
VTEARFHKAAADEAEAAVIWYNKRVPGLGDDFRFELVLALEKITERPNGWPVSAYDRRARRVFRARFPYSLVYVVGPDEVMTVVAVAHAKRRPAYWRDRG